MEPFLVIVMIKGQIEVVLEGVVVVCLAEGRREVASFSQPLSDRRFSIG
jgi:hypothetical protein